MAGPRVNTPSNIYTCFVAGADIGPCLRAAGYTLSNTEADRLAQECKIDPKAALTLDDACRVAQRVPYEQTAKAQVDIAFKPFDKFGDGTMTCRDMREVAGHMAEMKQDELDQLELFLDRDGVGRVYFSELLKTLNAKAREDALH